MGDRELLGICGATSGVWDMKHSENRAEFGDMCRDCVHCKRLYVPAIPSLDHARAVRDRFVCDADEESVMYLGDDEGVCEMFRRKNDK